MPIRPENKKRYPPEWKEISRKIRFERAGGRCEFIEDETGVRCEARHGEAHPFTGSKVILTTAHLNHTPEDCRPENLKAGCQRCHLRYDKDHHAETRRKNKEKQRKRELDKAGQMKFEMECNK